MSKIKNILAAAVLGAFAFTGAAKAATVTITPVLDQYFADDNALNNNQASTPSTTVVSGKTYYNSPGVYEIAVTVGTSLTSTDTTAGFTGFGDAYFDLNNGASSLPAGLTPNDEYGSTIYDRTLKENGTGTKYSYVDPVSGNTQNAGSGATPGTAMFSAIVDNGAVGDYKSLEAAMATTVYAGTDARLNATQSTQNSTLTSLDGLPLKAFDIFVNYDGVTNNVTLQPYANPATEGYGLHNNTTGLTTFFPAGTAGQTYTLNPMYFGAIPEPASIGLLGIAALGLIRRRQA